MAGKSFEQRAREQMADLRMQPDAAVWPEIEAALQKSKKRRWLIWFFPLLAVCGGVGVWYYYQNDLITKQGVSTDKSTAIISKERQNEKNIPIDATPEQRQPTATEKDNSQNKSVRKGTQIIDQPFIGTPDINDRANKTTAKLTIEKKNETVNKTIDHPGNTHMISNQVVDKQNGQPPVMPVTDTEKILVDQTKEIKNYGIIVPATDSVPVTLQNKETDTTETVMNLTTANPPAAAIQIIKKNKWDWNINVMAGNSGIRKALVLSVHEPVFNSGITPPGNNIPGNAQSLYKAPTVTDAFSFSVNLEAKKSAGKKHSIGISLGYGLYQNHIGIGRRVDSIIFFSAFNVSNSNGYYYRSTDSIAYTNRYHFLQAAFAFYTPFRLFRTLALQWQVGTGVNILLASNALQYSAGNNLLFSNRSLLRTVQVDVSTGIDIAIGKPAFLLIGPQWQYFLSDLSVQVGSNQHFLRSAVKAIIVLPKKEKKKMQR